MVVNIFAKFFVIFGVGGLQKNNAVFAFQPFLHAFKRERGMLSTAYSKSGDGLRASASPDFVSGGGIPSSEYPSGIRDTSQQVTFSTEGLDGAGKKE